MKKFIPVIALLLFVISCVTTSDKNIQFRDEATIRGHKIARSVSEQYDKDYVRRVLGIPDYIPNSDEWHYQGKTADEKTYIIYFMEDSVARIGVLTPKKE